MTKQLLVLPEDKKLTRAQLKELNDAGILVLYLNDPKQARLLTAEPPLLSGEKAFLAALKAIRRSDDYAGYRTFLDGLMEAVGSQDRASEVQR